MESRNWNTASGAEILALIRGDRGNRPLVDPALAGGLRAWLQDASYEAGEGSEPVLATPFQFGFATPASTRTPVAKLLGQLTTTLFIQRFTAPQALDPVMAACEQLRGRGMDAAIDELLASKDRLYMEEIAGQIRRQWPQLPSHWFPRFRQPMAVELSGRALRLYATPSLIMGPPAKTVASVCLVQTVSGPIMEGHRRGGRLLALIETLRSGAIPFQVVTNSVDTGEIEADLIDEAKVIITTRELASAIVEGSDLTRPQTHPKVLSQPAPGMAA